jgi:hypothetical protein
MAYFQTKSQFENGPKKLSQTKQIHGFVNQARVRPPFRAAIELHEALAGVSH